MTANYLGGASVGSAIPLAVTAVAAADAALLAALGDAQARVAGCLQALASVTVSPPSVAAAASFGAAAAASIAALVTSPTVGVSAAAAASVVADLGAIVAALEAQVAIIAGLKLTLGTAGLHLYKLQGEVGRMGSDLQGKLGGGAPGGSGASQLGTAFVLLAVDNGAIQALETVFGA